MIHVLKTTRQIMLCLMMVIGVIAAAINMGWADAPVATINIPADGDTFDYGDSVLFSGTGTDADGDPLLPYEWWSDKEAVNPFLTGNDVATTTLSSGIHTIRLIVKNDGAPNESGNDTITITINNMPPIPTITAPASGVSFDYGSAVNLTGSVTDAEDTAHGETPILTWSSDIDGTLGNSAPGVPLAISNLSSGTHVITLLAQDNGDPLQTGTDTINITINNTAPTATITAPATGTTYDYGANINFDGTGTDPEDVTLVDQNLVWTSSLGDTMGTGSPFSIDNLSSGTHTITLTVTDNGSPPLSDTDTITITINNAPPVATITAPLNNSDYDYGEVVTLTGTGTDAEDGDLGGASLAWTSSVAGNLGMGGTFPVSTLASGIHTISLTVTDSEGATNTDTISLTINNTPPVVTIENPTSGRAYYEGDAIDFAGSAYDPEEGAISGANLVWRSNLDGQIGTGESLSLSNLSSGEHTITLTAKDSKNLSASASITIKIGNNVPVVTIISPESGASVDNGVEIIFQGSATDTEDGTLEGGALVWSSNKDGQLGTGATITTDALSSGTHVITLTATDSKGGSGQATIPLIINNTAPEVAIESPTTGTSFYQGDAITFKGSGMDSEDGQLGGDSLVWRSSIDGQIGTGDSLNLNDLTAGSHTITLTATDSKGMSASDTITIKIGNDSPVVTISSPQGGTSVDNGVEIIFQGSATDTEDGTLGGSSLVWASDKDGQLGTGTTITRDNLSSGTHVITLTATDSQGAAGQATIPLTINNTPPVVTIESPTAGNSYYEGDSISFSGSGVDSEDGELNGGALVWRSSIDGQIGTGASFTSNTLSSGNHTITLTATDSKNLSASASITLKIGNDSPVAAITSPENGSSVNNGVDIIFEGTGTDTEDGTLSGASLVWTSSKDGQLGTGTTITKNTLSSGTHVITLTVTDSKGATGLATISLTISNTPPEVTIENPTTGRSYYEGETIAFVGSARDDEDGVLSGESLVWRSSLNGPLGIGTSISVTTLSPGDHTISLTATDSRNASASATITLKIGNDSPVATITAPADGSYYDDGVEILFQGTGSDTEDGTLGGASLMWSSNKDGEFGTGTTVAKNNLSSGTHVITLTVTDSQGATGKATLQVVINNNAPEVTINSPVTGDKFVQGDSITFNGTASDVEDGLLSGGSLTWTSNRDGVLGTGTNLTLNTLSNGEHVITLTAVDSQNEKGTASATISAGNIPPTATITAPPDNATYMEGDLIFFSGQATDDKDSVITGTSLQWLSNNNGRVQPIGVGNSFSTSNLDPGSHIITLTAKDSEGAIGEATVNLVITAKPTFSVSPTSLTLEVNQTGTITISNGNPPYRVFSRYVQIAKPTLIGSAISVLGQAVGTSELTITDADKASTTAIVTVTAAETDTETGTAPTANAGLDQTVTEGATVTLDGSASSAENNETLSYGWRQSAGPEVALEDNVKVNPTFVTPPVGASGATLVFELTVTNAPSARQDTDLVAIHVNDNGLADFGDGVLSFLTTTDKNMGIAVNDQAQLTRLEPFSLTKIKETIGKPQVMPYGMINFALKTAAVGDTAIITIYLPEAAPAGYTWVKYSSDLGWIDFSREKISGDQGDGAVFNTDRTQIRIYLTDDGEYDDDKSDAVLSDPSGLGYFPEESADDGGTQGKGGGCFVDSLF